MRLFRTHLAPLAAAALLSLSGAAFGQGAILQAGPRTAGHAPMYVGSGSGGQTTVQDSGPASGGGTGLGLSEILQVNRTTPGTGPLGTHNCLYSAPTNSASGYYYLCLDANANGGGLLVYGNGGAAEAQPFNLIVNGSAIPLESGLIINGTPITGGMSGGFLFNNGGVLSNTDANGSANLLTSGTFNIAIPVNDTRRGLNVSQTLPSSGSTPGHLYSNLIQGSLSSTITGSSDAGDPLCACWSLVQISASVGANYTGIEAYGLSVGNVVNANNATTSDLVGVSMGVSSSYRYGGNIYGGVASATAGAPIPPFPGGRVRALLGFEIGVAQNNPTISDVPIRYGLNVDNYGSHTASGMDTAISVQGGMAGGSWLRGITFTNPAGALAPAIAATGTLMSSEVALSVADGLDFSNITFSGNILTHPNAGITGAGVARFGATTSDGGITIVGAGGSNLSLTFQNGASPTYQIGAIAGNLYISHVGSSTPGLSVNSSGEAHAPGGIYLDGATSGSIQLKAAAVAGTNTITFPAGSTNFSGTGGPGQVVKQTTAGGGFTVATVGISEVSGLGTGIATALAVNAGTAGAVGVTNTTQTWSANQTFSAQGIFTGTSAPSSAAGQSVIMGTIAAPTLSNNGQAFVYNTSANGAVLQGAGSTFDSCLVNKSGNIAACVPTGAQGLNIVGAVNAFGATAIPAGGTAGTGYTFSSTANFGVFFGSNAPTLSAAKGSLYLRSNGTTTNDRAYINTDGGTTWTPLTTGSWLFERDLNPANDNRPAFINLAA